MGGVWPEKALSVRQPWAWAIVYGGKDVENRTRDAIVSGGMMQAVGTRIAIHAGKGMTVAEYDMARSAMAAIGVTCPPAHLLERGGLIGSVRVVGVVKESESSWFVGPRALVLAEPAPRAFVGAIGQLGLFEWAPNGEAPEAPARWMLRAAAAEREPRMI